MHRPFRLALLACLAAAPAFGQSGPPVPLPEPVPMPMPPPSTPTDQPGDPAGLQSALRNFPPGILVNNVRPLTGPGDPLPPPCPAAGSRVEQKGGPAIEFLGTGDNPDKCRMRVGPDTYEAWFGIWGVAWAGGDFAHQALDRIRHSKTGDVVGFDTVAVPGQVEWHDLIRQDGVEELNVLGKIYTAIKLTHYREGFAGNSYRSVSTLWIDVATGLPVYGTYQHISGAPELDGALTPTAIVPAP